MKLSREENWGELEYNTDTHVFSYHQDKFVCQTPPYVNLPIVLNCHLTYKCNLDCLYCVAKDMKSLVENDLLITDELILNLNNSPFMVIVLSGGEPLLPEYESTLLKIVNNLKNKGIIIDTNGTIFPSNLLIDALVKNNVLIRVSLDSPRPQDEWSIRISAVGESHEELYKRKLEIIPKLKTKNLQIAIQTVVHKKNLQPVEQLPRLLQSWGITQWYIQRFIPSYKLKSDKSFLLETVEYENKLNKLEKISSKLGISCITKKDRRHNCVFLLAGNSSIFTQSDNPGEKIYLGKLGEIENYFSLVSSSEHSMRYYNINSKL